MPIVKKLKEVIRMLRLSNIYKTFNKGTVNEKKALNGIDLVLQKPREMNLLLF